MPYAGNTIQERTANRIIAKPVDQMTDLVRRINNELLTTDMTHRNALFVDQMRFANAILDDVDTNAFGEEQRPNPAFVVAERMWRCLDFKASPWPRKDPTIRG